MTHEIHNAAVLAKSTKIWTYAHPLSSQPQLVLETPILSNGKPRVMSTDGKHLKKNGRGSATSGARVLVLGRYLVHYGLLASLALSSNTPLMKTDIIGVDKQDDRAAARLFSSAVIEHLSRTQQNELGLAIYLFIIGEIVDAQQNRGLPHIERVKMLWRGRFFLEGWRQNIVVHPHYGTNTHFITRELYDIISIYINAMLILILTHRDYFPTVPLLHWLHSTEVCEHFFGCARTIQKDFTYVQWILMIPKIVLMMAGDTKHKGSQAEASSRQSGYHHSWYDAGGLDVEELVTFPNDADFQHAITIGFEEAGSLLGILGIDYFGQDSLVKNIELQFLKSLQDLDDVTSATALLPVAEDEDKNEVPLSEGVQINEMLRLDAQEGGQMVLVESELHGRTMADMGVAATAMTIDENLKMYRLSIDIISVTFN